MCAKLSSITTFKLLWSSSNLNYWKIELWIETKSAATAEMPVLKIIISVSPFSWFYSNEISFFPILKMCKRRNLNLNSFHGTLRPFFQSDLKVWFSVKKLLAGLGLCGREKKIAPWRKIGKILFCYLATLETIVKFCWIIQ